MVADLGPQHGHLLILAWLDCLALGVSYRAYAERHLLRLRLSNAFYGHDQLFDGRLPSVLCIGTCSCQHDAINWGDHAAPRSQQDVLGPWGSLGAVGVGFHCTGDGSDPFCFYSIWRSFGTQQ